MHILYDDMIGECPLAFAYYHSLSTTSSIKRSPTITRSRYLFEHQLLAFPSPHVLFVVSQIPYILGMCFINISQTPPGGKTASDTLIHNSNQVFIYTQNGHLIAPPLLIALLRVLHVVFGQGSTEQFSGNGATCSKQT